MQADAHRAIEARYDTPMAQGPLQLDYAPHRRASLLARAWTLVFYAALCALALCGLLIGLIIFCAIFDPASLD